MNRILAVALIASVAACTTAQVDKATGYQTMIAGACSTAMLLSPNAGPIAPYIIGGCATEEAIARLALDPSSLAWVNNLVAKVKTR